MDAAQRWLERTAVVVFCLLVSPAWAETLLPVGQVVPLAVENGSCRCVLPTPNADDKYYLIVSSLATTPGPYGVTVQTKASTAPVIIPREHSQPDDGWARQVQETAGRLAKARLQRKAAEVYAPAAEPLQQRDFFLFAKGTDFLNPACYVTVTGLLQAVGRHCQVYLDRDEADPSLLKPTVDDLIRTFDTEVYPRACRTLGQALDVDRDGRFTILLSGWLGKLSDGKVAVGGFVRGSDFYRDLTPPFGNRCDMLYLNADLRPGPHLHALVAHEFTHAIVFSEHVFGDYLPGAPRCDEDAWLNEGLAHLAEDLNDYGWSNLDYRISAFLSAPERYHLVVPDYYGAGLWRSHGHRGSTYLFLRWCVDRYGPELVSRLIQTNQTGVANLEAATRERFAALFRGWSAALVLNGANFSAEGPGPLQRVDPRRPLAGRLLCGPRYQEVALAGGDYHLRLAGTASAYVLLHSPAGEHSRVTVRAEPGADLQVSLIRLPERTARLSLRVEAGATPRTIRLVLTAHDASVHLDTAAWERLAPDANRSQDTNYRSESAAAETVRAWFGEPALQAGETRRSIDVPLPSDAAPNAPWVIKVAATDPSGHRLATWATVTGHQVPKPLGNDKLRVP